MLIQEGDAFVLYSGGEVARMPLMEGLQKLSEGNYDALDPLSDGEIAYVRALQDKTWVARNGKQPRLEDFTNA